MPISRNDLARLGRLARLRLAPDETDRLASELAGILEHVRSLERIEGDASDAPEGPDPSEEAPDTLPEAPPAADRLRRPVAETAPAWREGFFVVPRLAPPDRGDGGKGDA